MIFEIFTDIEKLCKPLNQAVSLKSWGWSLKKISTVSLKQNFGLPVFSCKWNLEFSVSLEIEVGKLFTVLNKLWICIVKFCYFSYYKVTRRLNNIHLHLCICIVSNYVYSKSCLCLCKMHCIDALPFKFIQRKILEHFN